MTYNPDGYPIHCPVMDERREAHRQTVNEVITWTLTILTAVGLVILYAELIVNNL